MPRTRSKTILQVGLILLCAFASKPVVAQDQSAGARVHPGGVGRYTPGRWGLVGGTFTNPDPENAQEFTTIVMPPNGAGLQFGRQMVVPPGVSFVSEWPVFVPDGPGGYADFEYLKFEAGKVDQVVQEQLGEQFVQNFGASLGKNKTAWAAVMDSNSHSAETRNNLRRLSQILRYQEREQEGLLWLQLDMLSDQAEVFEPLEYLSLSDERLLTRPALMDALRLWVQRGGRLVVAVNLTGPELWNGLFGGTAPLTLIQEASSTDIRLQLNPNYLKTRHPITVVEKSYPEPIRYLRVIAENVEPIWNIDEWPVAIRLPFGEGEVIGLLIDARALIEQKRDDGRGIPWKLIDSGGGRMAELLYKLPEPKLITTDALLAQANQEIGYSIPAVSFPLIIAFGFPLLLIAIGTWLYRHSHPERLIWIVPIIAVVIALPPLLAGIQQRNVAPTTVVEYRTVRAIPGQSHIAADGASILYSSDGEPTSISSTGETQHTPPTQRGRREARRQMIFPSGERAWAGIRFPAGLTSIALKSSVSVTQPLAARLSFDENGITGTVNAGPFEDPSDLILAGRSPERMSLSIKEDGTVRGGLDRLLALDTFADGTLLSNQQIQRERTYRNIFDVKGRPNAFPSTPTLLYWANHSRSEAGVGDEQTVFTGTTLVAQPVQWTPPALNQPVLIPAAAIEYRGVASAGGKYSSTYSNQNREWVAREMATDFLLEFQIPDACTPFEPEKIDCTLRIRAPARKVILSAGISPQQLSEFHTANSPVGVLNVVIPPELVRESLQAGRFILQLDIGKLNLNAEDETPATGEQDDSWIIEQIQVNMTGRRTQDK